MRVHYVGANGEEPPLSELEREKLKGQQLANDIAETKLRRIHGEVIEKDTVEFLVKDTVIKLQQGIMRAASQALIDLRSFNLPHEQLHAIKMSLDRSFRAELDKMADAFEKIPTPREAYAEIVGEREPSPKAVAAARRKKARANAKRRVRRKVAAR